MRLLAVSAGLTGVVILVAPSIVVSLLLAVVALALWAAGVMVLVAQAERRIEGER